MFNLLGVTCWARQMRMHARTKNLFALHGLGLMPISDFTREPYFTWPSYQLCHTTPCSMQRKIGLQCCLKCLQLELNYYFFCYIVIQLDLREHTCQYRFKNYNHKSLNSLSWCDTILSH